ncbi:MAG: arginine--tRNA ligase [Succiniclasticum sp.]
MDIKAILADAIVAAAKQAIADGVVKEGALPEVLLEVPPKKEFGDFASNFAMQSARTLHCNPRILASYIQEHLDCPYVEKVDIAGPGFLNFYLKPDWMYDMFAHIVEAGENYGNLPKASDEKIQLEFVSANPTGPLHVGHGRGAAVGSSLANLLKAAGYNVEREYYINDAGNQMNNLAKSVNARYLELLGKPCEFPEDGYHGQDIVETAERILKKYGDKFLSMEEEKRLEIFKDLAYKEKLEALKEDLARFNVHFDVWFSEKTLHDAGKIREAAEYLKEKGFAYEKGGALWLKSTAFGDDKDRVIIRDNGVPTYFAADIAYHTNKFQRGFDRVINLWGADHHGYIARMKAAMQCMGFQPDHLEILVLQMVRLVRGDQEIKLSKRTGQTVTLNELIDEVGTDAARYFFVMRSIDSQLDFDLDLATKKSNDNPVFYVQYAHARICSILRQVEEAGIPVEGKGDYRLLTHPAEVDLIKKLGEYPELIATAARERAVQQVAHYVYELAGLFHTAYNQCRILGVDSGLQQARLTLVLAVGHVIRHALGILGVSAPEKM